MSRQRNRRHRPSHVELTLGEAFRALGFSPYAAAAAASGRPNAIRRSDFLVRLRCENCTRVIGELDLAPGLDEAPGIQEIRSRERTVFLNRTTGELRLARTPTSVELAERIGQRCWIFTCYESCGARYEIPQDELSTAFRAAVKEGRVDITAVQGVGGARLVTTGRRRPEGRRQLV